jgi:hypothetical protein
MLNHKESSLVNESVTRALTPNKTRRFRIVSPEEIESNSLDEKQYDDDNDDDVKQSPENESFDMMTAPPLPPAPGHASEHLDIVGPTEVVSRSKSLVAY